MTPYFRQQQKQQSTSTTAASSQNSQELNAEETVEHNSMPLRVPARKPVPKPPACSNFVGAEAETEQYENDETMTEEAMLEAAIRMSMQPEENS